MVDEKGEFRAALRKLRSGSSTPEEVRKFIEKFGSHIRRIVRRKLDRRMQSKYDSLDFEQMVWASFFRNPREIRSFKNPDDLFRYLAGVARHKVIQEYRRRLRSQKYDVKREQPLLDSDAESDPVESMDMTPSQVAMAREEWERLVDGQPKRVQEIIQMRIGGATYVEISEKLGINERTVRRVIDRLTRSSRAEPEDDTKMS